MRRVVLRFATAASAGGVAVPLSSVPPSRVARLGAARSAVCAATATGQQNHQQQQHRQCRCSSLVATARTRPHSPNQEHALPQRSSSCPPYAGGHRDCARRPPALMFRAEQLHTSAQCRHADALPRNKRWWRSPRTANGMAAPSGSVGSQQRPKWAWRLRGVAKNSPSAALSILHKLHRGEFVQGITDTHQPPGPQLTAQHWAVVLEELAEHRGTQALCVSTFYSNMLGTHDVDPNETCFEAVARAYALRGMADDCLRLMSEMHEADLQPTIDMWNAVLTACLRSSNVLLAEDTFRQLLQDPATPDANPFSYGLMLSLYGKLGWPTEATSLFHTMLQAKVEPTLRDYEALLRAYAHSTIPASRVSTIASIRNTRAHQRRRSSGSGDGGPSGPASASPSSTASSPTSSTTTASSASAVTNRPRFLQSKPAPNMDDILASIRAIEWQVMHQNFPVDVNFFLTLIDAYRRCGAVEFVQRAFDTCVAQHPQPGIRPWNELLRAHAERADVEMAELVLESMHASQMFPTSRTHFWHMLAYAWTGDVEATDAIFHAIPPPPSTSHDNDTCSRSAPKARRDEGGNSADGDDAGRAANREALGDSGVEGRGTPSTLFAPTAPPPTIPPRVPATRAHLTEEHWLARFIARACSAEPAAWRHLAEEMERGTGAPAPPSCLLAAMWGFRMAGNTGGAERVLQYALAHHLPTSSRAHRSEEDENGSAAEDEDAGAALADISHDPPAVPAEGRQWLLLQLHHVLIATYAQVPDADAVDGLLARLLLHGVQPTMETYDEVVKAYEAAADAARLEDLISAVQQEEEADGARVPDHWYTALMRAHVARRDSDAAIALMEKIVERGSVQDTSPLVSELAVVVAATGSVRWADSMLREMEEANMTPTARAYLHVIRAYSDELDIKAATAALGRAKRHAPSLSDEHYEALLVACLAVEDDKAAARVQRQLAQHRRAQRNKRRAGGMGVGVGMDANTVGPEDEKRARMQSRVAGRQHEGHEGLQERHQLQEAEKDGEEGRANGKEVGEQGGAQAQRTAQDTRRPLTAATEAAEEATSNITGTTSSTTSVGDRGQDVRRRDPRLREGEGADSPLAQAVGSEGVPAYVQVAWRQGFQLHLLAPEQFSP